MKKTVLFLAILATPALQAWECKYEKQIQQELDMSGSETLSVEAAAGDLEIKGGSGNIAQIRGRVCVSEEEWLDESGVEVSAGKNASIAVVLPRSGSGWSWTGSEYASLDLELTVPAGLALDVSDSSGDLSIEGVASVTVKDSSGDIEIEDIRGDVSLEDSSGDIDIEDIGGNVTVKNDSSGDIYGENIEGSALVMKDSSGGIRFSDVAKDFVVEKDSSGDITARDIGGDFRVLSDSSGDIRAHNVNGRVETPEG
jgi:DUF4097 and DUF4098 domain-containing protein YvlB